jgi:hypothetical protein
VFSGFSEDSVRRFAPQFASAGIVPVLGVGSVSDDKQPEALVPGSAVSAVLVRGDMDIAATCTVTYVDRIGFSPAVIPCCSLAPSIFPCRRRGFWPPAFALNAFKIVNATEPAGAFVQDRHTGILGEFDKKPEMIPVSLRIHGGDRPKSSTTNAQQPRAQPDRHDGYGIQRLHGVNEFGEEITYRVNGSASESTDFPSVNLENMFSSATKGSRRRCSLRRSLGTRFGRIYDNAYSVPGIHGVKLDFEISRERRWARLESARTDATEARPGDDITVEVMLRALPRRRRGRTDSGSHTLLGEPRATCGFS